MYGRLNALASYGKVANAETDPLRQIVLLYDGAIKFLRLAAAGIDSGDIAAKANYSNRALDIIGYLQSILDFERGGEVAGILDNLYSQMTLKILQASAALHADDMRRAAELLMPVRDSWATTAALTENAASLNAPPVASPARLTKQPIPAAVAATL